MQTNYNLRTARTLTLEQSAPIRFWTRVWDFLNNCQPVELLSKRRGFNSPRSSDYAAPFSKGNTIGSSSLQHEGSLILRGRENQDLKPQSSPQQQAQYDQRIET